MSECAHHSSFPWLQYCGDAGSARSARSVTPLPKRLMSPGSVVSCTAVGPARPGPTIIARSGAAACSTKPQLVGASGKLHDQLLVGPGGGAGAGLPPAPGGALICTLTGAGEQPESEAGRGKARKTVRKYGAIV